MKALVLILLVLTIIPSQWLLRPFEPLASRWARLWHRTVCSVLGLSVEVVGNPSRDAQTAYVGNHLSYLDIPVLGSVIMGSFVAKRDMRSWPLLGWLATLQRTIYISRAAPDASAVVDQLSHAVALGRNLIIFPEGTSSDGSGVLPFKSSLFAFLSTDPGSRLLLQPFTLDLLGVDEGGAGFRDRYAYHRDMSLGPHLWAFLHSRKTCIRIVFHKPVERRNFTDRKALATHLRALVAAGLHVPTTATAL